MNKSSATSPLLLKRIDRLLTHHHPFLQETDEVYYLGEYTNGKRADYSPVNRQILNYKKGVERKGKQDWGYKESAIKEVASLFRMSIFQTTGFPERAQNALLVPIPPHKSKSDPAYDDRNLQMLKCFMPRGHIHELILQKNSREPLHKSNHRDIENLKMNYTLNL